MESKKCTSCGSREVGFGGQLTHAVWCDGEDTINAKNPTAKDHLLTVRLCASTLKPLKRLVDLQQREAAEQHMDELLGLMQEIKKGGTSGKKHAQALRKTAIKEGWRLVRRVADMIQKYNAYNAFKHCRICHSSFGGFGPTLADAEGEAMLGLAEHTAKYHAAVRS